MSKVGSPLINWVLRAFQALFGIVILGLCVTLIRGHHWGGLPASLGYGAFVGGLTILAALVGVAAVWLEFLDGIVDLAVDGLAAILNLAGGVFLAIKLKGTDCKISQYNKDDEREAVDIVFNDLMNGGCLDSKNFLSCYYYQTYGISSKADNSILGHCRESRAAMVFMFMATALLLASALMGFLRRRKGY